jgi:hypothetical protein
MFALLVMFAQGAAAIAATGRHLSRSGACVLGPIGRVVCSASMTHCDQEVTHNVPIDW